MISSAVIEQLAVLVDTLDLDADDGELAAVLALRDRLDAHVAAGVRAVDAAELWDARGATSMTAWVADRARMPRGRAATMVRVARLVQGLPVTAVAWASGALSTGQVETICSFLTDTAVEVFARQEDALIPVLTPLGLRELAAAMRAWRANIDEPDARPERPGSLHASRTLAGRTRVDGDLDAETGELLLAALRVAGQASRNDEGNNEGNNEGNDEGNDGADDQGDIGPRSPGQRRADALGDICRFFLDRQTTVPDGQRHRPHINLVFDAVPTADGGFDIAGSRTVDGTPIDRVTAGRHLCDSLLYRVLVHGKSAIIDYAGPPGPSHPRCGTPCCYATSVAAGRAATGPAIGPKRTMSCRGKTAARPPSATSSACAAGTTTSSTGLAGTPPSNPTAPSTSPTPGAPPAPPGHPPTPHPCASLREPASPTMRRQNPGQHLIAPRGAITKRPRRHHA